MKREERPQARERKRERLLGLTVQYTPVLRPSCVVPSFRYCNVQIIRYRHTGHVDCKLQSYCTTTCISIYVYTLC